MLTTVRNANLNDARSLAEFADRTFRDTFGDTNTAEDMDQFCQTAYSERIQASEISDPNAITLLSESGAIMIGFAQLRWDRAPDCVEGNTPGEIRRLYVDAGWHGKGAARDLMNACLQEMVSRRSEIVWLGVWERNWRAISFYRRFGFSEVGDHVFTLGVDRQRDIVMALPIVGSTPSISPTDTDS